MDVIGNFLDGVANAAKLVVLGLSYVALALLVLVVVIYSILWMTQEIDRIRRQP